MNNAAFRTIATMVVDRLEVRQYRVGTLHFYSLSWCKRRTDFVFRELVYAQLVKQLDDIRVELGGDVPPPQAISSLQISLSLAVNGVNMSRPTTVNGHGPATTINNHEGATAVNCHGGATSENGHGGANTANGDGGTTTVADEGAVATVNGHRDMKAAIGPGATDAGNYRGAATNVNGLGSATIVNGHGAAALADVNGAVTTVNGNGKVITVNGLGAATTVHGHGAATSANDQETVSRVTNNGVRTVLPATVTNRGCLPPATDSKPKTFTILTSGTFLVPAF
jgi:hypothetical protein